MKIIDPRHEDSSFDIWHDDVRFHIDWGWGLEFSGSVPDHCKRYSETFIFSSRRLGR